MAVNLAAYYGGFMAIILLGIMFIFMYAKVELTDAIKIAMARMRNKGRFSRMIFIFADMSTKTIYTQTTDSLHEYEDARWIMNPAKAVTQGGIKSFFFVNNNSASHDFIHDPSKMLQKILDSAKEEQRVKIVTPGKRTVWQKVIGKKGTEETTKEETIKDITPQLHNIWDEPYKFDAQAIQSTISQAQLATPTIVDKLLRLFTSKNFMTMTMITVGAAGAAAVLGFVTYNEIVNLPLCQNIAAEVINV